VPSNQEGTYCPPGYDPTGCTGMTYADNPAPYCGSLYGGFNNLFAPDPIGLLLFTACNSEGRETGLVNRATVANGLGLQQAPNQSNTSNNPLPTKQTPFAQAAHACGNAPPMSSSARNPYALTETYLTVNAQAMFQNGGNGSWGQDVCGCLACMHGPGADTGASHRLLRKRISEDERIAGNRRIWTSSGRGNGNLA
jgi:hypothetical protein